jgi:hypothetical protein
MLILEEGTYFVRRRQHVEYLFTGLTLRVQMFAVVQSAALARLGANFALDGSAVSPQSAAVAAVRASCEVLIPRTSYKIE